MKVLFDNNIAPSVSESIDAVVADDMVVSLRSKFPASTDDVDWLGTLGSEGGWTIITFDRAMLKRPSERTALRRSGVNAFFLKPGWQKRTNLQVTAHLLLRWPSLQQTVKLVGGGSIFHVPINAGSKLEQHYL